MTLKLQALRAFLGRWVRYVWALRVPTFSAVLLVLLPWLAFGTNLRPFLSGLFDPIGEWSMAPIVALALFDAWTVVIIASLILEYGHDRFGLPKMSLPFPPTWRVWAPATLLLAGPVIVKTARYSAIPVVVPGAAGAAVAGVLALVAFGITKYIGRLDRSKLQWWQRFLGGLEKIPLLACGFIKTSARTSDEGVPEEHRAIAPGHGLAFGLSVSSVLLYLAIGFFTRNVQRPHLASALAYVLLLILVLTWLAGAVAFFFDRVRLPLLLLFGVWALIVTYAIDRVTPSDHVYQTFRSEETIFPEDVAHLLQYTTTPILVAVSGGGIEAGAWAAHAMTELDHIDGFRQSVRLVSAVSGGSVGTMNMLAGWPACGSEPPVSAFDADAASRESSLHAVGWGLAFADLPRTVAPFLVRQRTDRGSVLEDAWKRESRLQASGKAAPVTFLASWRAHVAAHLCPGVIFNSMVAESGEPMLFSTVQLPQELKAFSFSEHYPGRDVPISTAVRMSAAFPYISPAARADRDGSSGYAHLVDGGYLDNYGVGTLAALANAALAALPTSQRRHLLVIEICDASECSGQTPPERPSAGGQRRGWPYQLFAPLSAIIAERSEAQRVTDHTTLDLLAQSWGAKATCIEVVHIPLGRGDAPMSWHLTDAEKRAVDVAWAALNQSTHVVDRVRAYLQGGASASCQAGA